MRALTFLVLVLSVAACRPLVIPCDKDEFCLLGGERGRCLPAADGAKYCAFSDGTCVSGLRWDSSAEPSIASKCYSGAGVDGGEDGRASVDLFSTPDGWTGDLAVTGRWVAQKSGTAIGLAGVWGDGKGLVFAVGDELTTSSWVLSTNDGGVHWAATSINDGLGLFDVFGLTSNDALAVGRQGAALRWDGNSWKAVSLATGEGFSAVWPSPKGAYIIADGRIRRWISGTWHPLDVTRTSVLMAISGFGPDHVVAVGEDGAVWQSKDDGNTWAQCQSKTTVQLKAVWWHASGVIVAVGANGTITRSNDNGANWTVQDSGTTMGLRGVWGSGPTDVYAVGVSGTILHSSDGVTWKRQDSGTTQDLADIWGSSPSNIYIVGRGGTILHLE